MWRIEWDTDCTGAVYNGESLAFMFELTDCGGDSRHEGHENMNDCKDYEGQFEQLESLMMFLNRYGWRNSEDVQANKQVKG